MNRSLPLVLLAGGLVACADKPALTAEKKEAAPPTMGTFIKKDSAFDSIVSADAKIEQIASGHKFTEGPLWTRHGTLLFSDIPANTIFQWTTDGKIAEYRGHSGYEKDDYNTGEFVGSNGLTMDAAGNVIICEHRNGRVGKLTPDGKYSIVVAKFGSKRLNSPNDAVVKSNGDIYFTDPPYGLAKQDDDPMKELKFNGVYRVSKNGKLDLLHKELTRPNGLAFSPDEKTLYVANSDEKRKIWMKFDVDVAGKIANGKIFFDATAETADGLPDGMKIDKRGNLYCTGPGGVWVFTPEGKHLGTIAPKEVPANVAFGDADGKTLYMTARTGVYKVRVNIEGIRPL